MNFENDAKSIPPANKDPKPARRQFFLSGEFAIVDFSIVVWFLIGIWSSPRIQVRITTLP